MTIAIIRPGGSPVIRSGENVGEAARQAVRAETAADAAAASEAVALAAAGPNYADTSAGLAATGEGDTFAVEDDGIVSVYRHDAGPTATLLRVLPTTAALASTDPGRGASMVGVRQSDSGAVGRTVADKLADLHHGADYGLSTSGDQAEAFADFAAALAAARVIGRLGPGDFETSETAVFDGTGNTLGGLIGEGPERSVIRMTDDSKDAVALAGQYTRFGGFTVEYANVQTRAHSAKATVLLGTVDVSASYSFTSLDQIVTRYGYYGFKIASGPAVEQNNWCGTLRARSHYGGCFVFDNVSSGSAFGSLYASNPDIANVLTVARFSGFSGTVNLLNAEHSTVAGAVVDFDQAHNFRIVSLHCEGLSLMRNGMTLDPTGICGFVRTSGKGTPGITQFAIDSSHVGALIVRPGLLTRTGTTARAYLHVMGLQQKTVSESAGLEVGDTVFIEGADTSTSNEYNGSHTVTAAGVDGTGHFIEFEVGGTPASPAEVASGADCITASRGSSVVNAIPLVYGTGPAREFVIDDLFCRDIRAIGATASRRQSMLRFVRSDAVNPFRLRIGNISTEGQRSAHAYWLGPRTIAGYSRASNVTTLYFQRPHGLRPDSALIVYGATADTSFNGTVTGTLTVVSPFAVSFAQTGSDVALKRDVVTRAILRTFALSTVERSGNYATYTFTAPHGLDAEPVGVGLRLSIQAEDSAYSVADGLILDVPDSTSVVLRNVGSDESPKSDSGGAMLIEGGLSETPLTENSTFSRVSLPEDWITYQTVLGVNEVTAGNTVVQATETVLRATPGRHRVQILSVTGGDARLLVSGAISGTNQVQFSHTNPTGGSITPSTAAIVTYRVLGD